MRMKSDTKALGKTSSMKAYLSEMESLKSKQNRISSARDVDTARVVSPWRQDDPVYVRHLKRRSKSAPSFNPKAAIGRPKAKVLPLEEEAVTHLPRLEDVLRNDSTLYPQYNERDLPPKRQRDKTGNGVRLSINKPINGSSFISSYYRAIVPSSLDRERSMTHPTCPLATRHWVRVCHCDTGGATSPNPRMVKQNKTRDFKRFFPAGHMTNIASTKNTR